MSVDFTIHYLSGQNSKSYNNAACFYSMMYMGVSTGYPAWPDYVDYNCKIMFHEEDKDDAMALWYCGFLRSVLSGGCLSWSSITTDQSINNYYRPGAKVRRINFRLITRGMKRHVALLHLTACRYLEEYPNLVKAFYLTAHKQVPHEAEWGFQRPIPTSRDLFQIFQRIHAEIASGRCEAVPNARYGFCGHGLIAHLRLDNPAYIPLVVLKERMDKGTVTNVNQHFVP